MQGTRSPEPLPPGVSRLTADSKEDQHVEDQSAGVPEPCKGWDDAAESRQLKHDSPRSMVEATAGVAATRASPSPAEHDGPAGSRLATSDSEAPAGAPPAAVAQAAQSPAPPAADACGHAAEPGQQPTEHSDSAQPPAGKDRAAAAECAATRRPAKGKAREWTSADSSGKSDELKEQPDGTMDQRPESSTPPGMVQFEPL